MFPRVPRAPGTRESLARPAQKAACNPQQRVPTGPCSHFDCRGRPVKRTGSRAYCAPALWPQGRLWPRRLVEGKSSHPEGDCTSSLMAGGGSGPAREKGWAERPAFPELPSRLGLRDHSSGSSGWNVSGVWSAHSVTLLTRKVNCRDKYCSQ